MALSTLHVTKALIAFICSINFMFLCSYCATLGLEANFGNVVCNTEKDCMLNSICIDRRYCECNKDFVQDSSSKSCLPKSKFINETCVIDVQCTASFGRHAQCFKTLLNETTGQCRCEKNAHFQDGICYESVRLGGACKVSDNCVSVSNIATYCAFSVCVCTNGYHPSHDRLDCLPNIALGKACKRDEDCIANNAYCSADSLCTCQPGYVRSTDGNTCLLAAKNLRAQCLEDSQCQKYLPNTFCDSQDNNCKCVPFSHELDRSCWISARLGESCSHPNQCITPSHNKSIVSCTQGVCDCALGYTRGDLDCDKLKDVAAESSSLEKCLFLTIAVVLLSLPSD